MKLVVLKLLCAALVVATVAVALRDSRSAGARRSTVERVALPSPELLAIEKRSMIKSQLTRRFLDERPPLLEAAELFNQVNGEDGTANLHLSVPGRSFREKLCRQVILYVSSTENEMEGAGHVWTGTRLSAEYQAELERRLAAGEFPANPELE